MSRGLLQGAWFALIGILVCSSPSANAAEAGAAEVVPRYVWLEAGPSPIALRGWLPDEAVISGGGMAYPMVGGVFGLVAGILTHGALVDAERSRQKTAAQMGADRVTEPYQELLKKWTLSEMLHAASAAGAGLASAPEWVAAQQPPPDAHTIDFRPAFVLTQDQRALLMEGVVMVRAPGQPQQAAVPIGVQVVSLPLKGDSPRSKWLADQGAMFKAEVQGLLQEGLRMALAIARQPADADVALKQRTVRFFQGGEERAERARVLKEACDRWWIKNLRGDWMSVPPKGASADEGCARGSAVSLPADQLRAAAP